jgi:ABC-type Fe3+/spermidine/putrescine transport system ATPase subunit
LGWADEILVLKNANIVQQGEPELVYRQPVSEYVAGLFGRYNLIGGVFVRPEDLRIVKAGKETLCGTVEAITFQGSYYEVEVRLSGDSVVALRTRRNDLGVGELICLSLA